MDVYFLDRPDNYHIWLTTAFSEIIAPFNNVIRYSIIYSFPFAPDAPPFSIRFFQNFP